jgi:hypothetical protein
MMKILPRFASICISLFFLHTGANAQEFSLTDKSKPLMILYSKDGPKLDSITAYLLTQDIERATGRQPTIVTENSNAEGNVIVIGNVQSKLIQSFTGKVYPSVATLKGKWECFALKVMNKPVPGVSKAFVIAGSDARGTAYGVFNLSEKIGVSPWYWWADVPVKQKKELVIHQEDYVSSTPSVRFRGIFINDEDWGLRPWASFTFEPNVKNIGPKTYAKVFELLLRLKANFIWPAMHPGTDPFYSVPGNKETAAAYSIVIGSSHAEPMLRNNVGEWDEKTMGPFNYITNKEKVQRYWEERVKESSGNDVVYTMGMRGVHDGQMEGVKSAKEAVPLLEQIIKYQRDLLKKYNRKELQDIPQVLTPYKEVLEFYDNGLKVPEDITLVWPDDNYGYIQRLSNEQEQKRAGGAGVYYHASYWGRPHDYLWLSSTHPSLIREEMMKAYKTGADRLWVLNVGDIKPLEYNIQFFLDMAYSIQPFKESGFTQKHLRQWNGRQFGNNAEAITDIMWKYYRLAFERRPEFMGWSQTEPTTSTRYSTYNHFYYGDQAQHRIDEYNRFETEVRQLSMKMDVSKRAAFYQLVYYPVLAAAEMNKKFLYRDKAHLYGLQNRISAYDYAAMSNEAYDHIIKATEYFNDSLEHGKWKNMMSMAPRELPVFSRPVLPSITIDKEKIWGISVEGNDTVFLDKLVLPVFINGLKQRYFIDVYLSDSVAVTWDASTSEKWIRLSQQKGILFPQRERNQVRLWVSVDWNKAPGQAEFAGSIHINGEGKRYVVKVNGLRPEGNKNRSSKDFLENNGYVSIYVSHYTEMKNRTGLPWQRAEGLGHTGASMMTAISLSQKVRLDTGVIKNTASYLAYDLYTFTSAIPNILIYALPTLPLNKDYSLRCGVSIDGGPLQIVDFTSNSIARTEEWKQNVLGNTAIRKIEGSLLAPGKHTLRIFAIDPGVILDRFVIDVGGMKTGYGVILETR